MTAVDRAISADGRYVAFASDANNLVVEDTNGKPDIFVHDADTGLITRVSVDSGGNQGDGYSYNPSISADGRYVAFSSYAENLVAGDSNGAKDIFVHDTATGATTRVSVDDSGNQGDGNSGDPSISADGRYLAFHSYASNLVAGDGNDTQDIFVHDTATGTTTRVSVDSSGGQGNGNSEDPSISADSRYVAFGSSASNLVAGDTNGGSDIFVHDTATGATTRVSVDASGSQGNHSSYYPSISADGRYVAFYSHADNLVAGDTNGKADIFVHDTATGTTTRVSVDNSGNQGDNDSYVPSISADGSYVAFSSYADNLVAGDSNDTQDIFVHDTATGATSRVSVDSSGGQTDYKSARPSISADGRYLAFSSQATNLVVGDTNYEDDIFVHDTATATTTRVSSPPPVNGDSRLTYVDRAISADGRYVAFESAASNLVPEDTNGAGDIFLHDTATGTTTRVSVDSSGGQGNGDSEDPSISADGRYLAFESYADNLVAGDTNGKPDIFVHDTATGTTTRVSVDSGGNQVNSNSSYPSISADGRYVAFGSYAYNLVAGDTNGAEDIFVHDTATGTTTRVSVDGSGDQSNSDSAQPSINADGRYLAFHSYADNLVAGDTNGKADIFVHDTATGATTRVSVDGSGNQGNGYSYNPSISADGSYVAFSSYADNLVAGDSNGAEDIFVRDTATGATTRVSVDDDGNQGNGNSYEPSICADGSAVAFRSYATNLDGGTGLSEIFLYDGSSAPIATMTQIDADDPDPSMIGEWITVSVGVTGGSPTGEVGVRSDTDESCVATLSNGSGSCTIIFTNAGNYTLTATYPGDAGHLPSTSAAEPHQVVASVPGPTAHFTASPNPASCGQSISFDDSGSSAGHPSRTLQSWTWEFGDGSAIGSGETTTHAYDAFGSYPVTLTVTDDAGDTGTDTQTLEINQGNTPPVAEADGPYTSVYGHPVTLDGSASYDPDAGCGDAITAYDWDIDHDGQYDDAGGANPTIAWSPQLQALGVGTHTIGLQVTDIFGATATATTTLTIKPVVDLSLTKSDSADPVQAGTQLVYTIHYANGAGAGQAASNVVLIESYDPNVTYVNAVPAPDVGNNQWNIGTLAPGMAGTITVTVQVNSPLPNGTVLTNNVQLTANEGSKTVSEQTTVTSHPVFNLTKSDSPDPVQAGKQVVYTINYGNSGNEHATNVVLTESYDANVVFVDAVPSPDVGNNQWNIGGLAPGNSSTITVTVLVNSDLPNDTVLTNGVTLTATEGSKTASEQTTVLAPHADLAITKSDRVTSAVPGGSLTYTIVATNNGPSGVTGASLTDSFPGDLSCSYTSAAADGATGNTSPGSGNLSDTLSLPSGSSVTYTVNCDIAAGATGTLSNTATISATLDDPVPGNNSATDDDTLLVDVVVIESDGTTAVDESGTSDSFSVVLTGQPGGDVVIDVSSDDTGEATVDPASLTFTGTNWFQPQAVTVTGRDDFLVDGTQTSTVTVHVNDALSDDAYDPVEDKSVSVTTTDDDTAGFTVSESEDTTVVSETGTFDTFTVVLDTEPASDVVLSVTSDDTGEATVDQSTLTFTSTDWDTPQTVTVYGEDDFLIDGTQTSTITISVVDADSDPAFGAVADRIVNVDTTDDDAAGYTVTESLGATAVGETGTQDTFTVVLDAQPLDDVVITVASGDTGEATVDPVSLRFTNGDWDQPQMVTVTGVDDPLVDGEQTTVVTLGVDAGSSDDEFGGLSDQTVDVTTSDDDSAGYTVTESNDNTEVSETGTVDTFTVVLDAQPLTDVVIDVTSGDTGEAIVDRASLTFTYDDWDQAQTVTVTGVDDPLIDGDQTFDLTLSVDDGQSDFAFGTLADQTVSVINADDDAAGFVVTETGTTLVDESGTTDSFTLVLTARPDSDVVIDVASGDTGEATVDQASLTFAPAEWNIPQTVTVTGVDDPAIDGDQTFDLTLGINDGASDDNFDPLDDQSVTVTTTDDDVAGYTVTESGGTTQVDENGGTDSFTLVLDAQPLSEVVIDVTSGDTGEATVEPTSLTFTGANWDQPQTVTVTGVDDLVVDGDQTTSVTLSVNAAASDDAFDGLTDREVIVTTSDDDAAGFTVTESGGTTQVEESGTTDSFAVVLDVQPLSDVVITISSGDSGEVTVDQAALTFTADNWYTPQTVVVTGVDDLFDDGDQTTAVTLSVDGPASDAAFGGLSDQNVQVTTVDDDTAGITVTPTGGLFTTESGGSASFTVVLDARPTADVTVGLGSSDITEGTVSTTGLTFTAGNWNTPQTVTVTGVDDDAFDGDIAYGIQTAAAASADPAYSGTDPADVAVANVDDEVQSYTGPTATGTGDATLTISGGACALDLDNTAFITTDGLELPPTVEFPHGAVEFQLTGCAPGATINVTLTFPDTLDGATGWKLDAQGNPLEIPGAVIDSNTLSYTAVEGGPLDEDGTEDGNFHDPAAPGFLRAAAPAVPTIGPWGLWVLAVAALVLGWRELTTRRPLV